MDGNNVSSDNKVSGVKAKTWTPKHQPWRGSAQSSCCQQSRNTNPHMSIKIPSITCLPAAPKYPSPYATPSPHADCCSTAPTTRSNARPGCLHRPRGLSCDEPFIARDLKISERCWFAWIVWKDREDHHVRSR